MFGSTGEQIVMYYYETTTLYVPDCSTAELTDLGPSFDIPETDSIVVNIAEDSTAYIQEPIDGCQQSYAL